MERDKLKTDLSALFMPRQPPMSAEDAVSVQISVPSMITMKTSKFNSIQDYSWI